MTLTSVDGQVRDERVTCVENKALHVRGERMFHDAGAVLPRWERQRKPLIAHAPDLLRSNEMARRIRGLGRLEPFTMQARPSHGAPLALPA